MSSNIVMSVTMTFLLSVIFGYLFLIQKEKSVGIWAIAWLVSTSRQIIVNLLNIEEAFDFALAVNEILISLCAILFCIGSYYYLNRKPPQRWEIIFIVISFWSAVSLYLDIHFMIRITPVVLLLLYTYLKTGFVFLNNNENYISNKLLGFSFISGGFMTIFFVISINAKNIIHYFAPWVYPINFILAIIMAISMLDVSYRLQINKIRERDILLVKADEYDRIKTEFFTTISHELKTPLNIILGIIQIQSNNVCKQSSACTRYIKIMKQNCFRLLKLINNLIDISKLDSGAIKLNCANCDIVNVIETITESVVEYASNLRITLIFDTEVEEKIISCDVDKVERIVLNLLSNAIKFSNNDGLIEVNIKDRDDCVIVSIKDSGVGIPEEKKQLIFKRFGQVDSSLTRKREGSGIGLSLVKLLVELHGGEIFVESEVNRGSEFVFTLPNRLNDEISSSNTKAEKEVNIERLQIEFADIYGVE